ncbi:hypothetical protein SO802_024791 [Lithocarpus litseifolius]|uniref:Uncharacterized protein n=1 Tax=Lithocarpus litseifolius TaxID=425828 RepID=A0AAW2CC83_9ROSI
MTLGLSPNKERGIGLLWGPDCTEDFLKKFNLKLIIRSHGGPDAKRTGFGGMDEGYTIDHVVESGKLITVFSALDYPQFQAGEERYKNKGAYVILEPPNFDNPKFYSFEAVAPRPQTMFLNGCNPYYDYVDAIDSDEELDLASMVTKPEAVKVALGLIAALKLILVQPIGGGDQFGANGFQAERCNKESLKWTGVQLFGVVTFDKVPTGFIRIHAGKSKHLFHSSQNELATTTCAHILYASADVVKEEDCRRFVNETINFYGRVDHLVNAASLGHTFYFEEVTDTSVFPHLMDINFWGNVYPTYVALPYLHHSNGRIIVNASVDNWLPLPRMSLYAGFCTKHSQLDTSNSALNSWLKKNIPCGQREAPFELQWKASIGGQIS